MYIDYALRGEIFERLIEREAERAVHLSFQVDQQLPYDPQTARLIETMTGIPEEFLASGVVIYRAGVSLIDLVNYPSPAPVDIRIPVLSPGGGTPTLSIACPRVGVRVALRFDLARRADALRVSAGMLPEIHSLTASVIYEMKLENPDDSRSPAGKTRLIFVPTAIWREEEGAVLDVELQSREEWVSVRGLLGPELEPTWALIAASFPEISSVDLGDVLNIANISGSSGLQFVLPLFNSGILYRDSVIYARFQMELRSEFDAIVLTRGWFQPTMSLAEREAWRASIRNEWTEFYGSSRPHLLAGLVSEERNIVGRYPGQMFAVIMQAALLAAIWDMDRRVRVPAFFPGPTFDMNASDVIPNPDFLSFGNDVNPPLGIVTSRGEATWRDGVVFAGADITILGLCPGGYRHMRATLYLQTSLATEAQGPIVTAVKADLSLRVSLNNDDLEGCGNDRFPGAGWVIVNFGAVPHFQELVASKIPLVQSLQRVTRGANNLTVRALPSSNPSTVSATLLLTIPQLEIFSGLGPVFVNPVIVDRGAFLTPTGMDGLLVVSSGLLLGPRASWPDNNRPAFSLIYSQDFEWVNDCQFRPQWKLTVRNDSADQLLVDWPRWVNPDSPWADGSIFDGPPTNTVGPQAQWRFRLGVSSAVAGPPFAVPAYGTVSMILEINPDAFYNMTWSIADWRDVPVRRRLPRLDLWILTSAGTQRVTIPRPGDGNLPLSPVDRERRLSECRMLVRYGSGSGAGRGHLPAEVASVDGHMPTETIAEILLRENIGVFTDPEPDRLVLGNDDRHAESILRLDLG